MDQIPNEKLQSLIKERREASFVRKAAPMPVRVKVLDDSSRVLRFAISDQRRDRDGDIVRQLGIKTANYERNPVVFQGRGPKHANSGFPVARSVKLFRKYIDNLLTTFSDALFAGSAQGHAEAELSYKLARDGFLNTASIGFGPMLVDDLPDDVLTEQEKVWRSKGYLVMGSDIKVSDLWEWTLVGVPSNVGASATRSAEPAEGWPVARVMDTAREFLKGADLDAFRLRLIGTPEVIEVGAYSLDKVPEIYIPNTKSVGDVELGFIDPGFDLWQASVGHEDPEPEAAVFTNEPEVKDAPTPDAGGDPAAGPENTGEGEMPAMNGRADVLRHAICALMKRYEANPAQDLLDQAMEMARDLEALLADTSSKDPAADPATKDAPQPAAPAPAPSPAPVFDPSELIASFQRELQAATAEVKQHTERSIADVLVQVWLTKEDEVEAAKAAPTSVMQPASDPAPVGKDVSPPAAVTNHAPNLSAQDVAVLAGLIMGQLDVAGMVKQALYEHRGGIPE